MAHVKAAQLPAQTLSEISEPVTVEPKKVQMPSQPMVVALLRQLGEVGGVTETLAAQITAAYGAIETTATRFTSALYSTRRDKPGLFAKYDAMEEASDDLRRLALSAIKTRADGSPSYLQWTEALKRGPATPSRTLARLNLHIDSLLGVKEVPVQYVGVRKSVSTAAAAAGDDNDESVGSETDGTTVSVVNSVIDSGIAMCDQVLEGREGTAAQIPAVTLGKTLFAKLKTGLAKLARNVNIVKLAKVAIAIYGMVAALISNVTDIDINPLGLENLHDILEGVDDEEETRTAARPRPVPSPESLGDRIMNADTRMQNATALVMLSDVKRFRGLDQEGVDMMAMSSAREGLKTGLNSNTTFLHIVDHLREAKTLAIPLSKPPVSASRLFNHIRASLTAGLPAEQQRYLDVIINFMHKPLLIFEMAAGKTAQFMREAKTTAVAAWESATAQVSNLASRFGKSRAAAVGAEILQFVRPFVPFVAHTVATVVDTAVSPESAAMITAEIALRDGLEHLANVPGATVANLARGGSETNRERMQEMANVSEFCVDGWRAVYVGTSAGTTPNYQADASFGSPVQWIESFLATAEVSIRKILTGGLKKFIMHEIVAPALVIAQAGLLHPKVAKFVLSVKGVFPYVRDGVLLGLRVTTSVMTVVAIANAFTPHGPALVGVAVALAASYLLLRHGKDILRFLRFAYSKISEWCRRPKATTLVLPGASENPEMETTSEAADVFLATVLTNPVFPQQIQPL